MKFGWISPKFTNDRLLQGDVGSGKPSLLSWGMAMVIEAGCQAALMAPYRHFGRAAYQTIRKLLTVGTEEHPAFLQGGQVRLLTGYTVRQIGERSLQVWNGLRKL
jgi:RecG-like helicase